MSQQAALSIHSVPAAVVVCAARTLHIAFAWSATVAHVHWSSSSSRHIMCLMRQEDIWDTEAAESYDTPHAGMFSPDVLQPTVERLAELAREGRALEFAIGTGRVATRARCCGRRNRTITCNGSAAAPESRRCGDPCCSW